MTPWRSHLARSLDLNRTQPHSRYFQLATVSSSGEPKNRTVVFRGFRENTDHIQIVTDERSEKIAQIQHQPRGEICWYFSETREQFRLLGQLTLVNAVCGDRALQQERQQTWQTLSEAARLQFAWPDPGQPRTKNAEAFEPSSPALKTPPSNFCLLLLDPERVDYLQLSGNPHNRSLYRRDRDLNWSIEEINP